MPEGGGEKWRQEAEGRRREERRKLAAGGRDKRGGRREELHTLQSFMVTGPRRRMVVTLSRRAERTAARAHSMQVKYHKFPRANLYVFTEINSKNPVEEKIPTRIIIPKSRPKVSKSIRVTTW
jgi:hypothetical protein